MAPCRVIVLIYFLLFIYYFTTNLWMVMYHGFHKNIKQISNTTVYNIDNIINN